MKRMALLLAVGVAVAAVLWGATSIKTEGDVEANAFIGNGAQLTSVDADKVDGFEGTVLNTRLTNAEALLVAVTDQVSNAPLCRVSSPAFVPRTGQTTSYSAGDDGDLERGFQWPNPRLTGNGDGTVTDELTGLIWFANANCIATGVPGFDTDGTAGDGAVTWQHALDFVAGLNSGLYGTCATSHSDWRLPNLRELQSLVNYGFTGPAVPNTAGTGKCVNDASCAFSGVETASYWSSSTHADTSSEAWFVNLYFGFVGGTGKTGTSFVWPVRGGQ